MKVLKPEIPGLLVIEPDVFKDQRGFYGNWNAKHMQRLVWMLISCRIICLIPAMVFCGDCITSSLMPRETGLCAAGQGI